ncbi:MAG: hypothetical protein FJ009_04665 [Chloroflexi bacterium]|nr:hypothetical protein [Chloroflexota bacterium]
MHSRFIRAIVLFFVITSLGVLACDLSTFGLGPAPKPNVTILAPVSNAQFNEGEEIQVQSVSNDSSGVARVELAVDGATVATDVPPIPKGQTAFTVIQRWKATPGTHTLSVRAFNASGAASEPALVTIIVAPSFAQLPTPIPTQVVQPPLGAPSPTLPQPVATQPGAPQPTATRVPTRPPASPTTITAPPGVYATAIRVEPKDPKRGAFVKFVVTFLNTTPNPQTIRWRVRVFEPDKRNSFGDTAPLDITIPVGLSDHTSAENWRVTGPGDCIPFFARVFSIDPGSRQETEFVKPDGSGGPAAGFQVCP